MAMFEFGLVALFLLILVIVFLAALLIWGLKHAVVFAINSVIGFFSLYAVKAFAWPELVINYWSVAIVAIGGIFGFAIVLLLYAMGIFFNAKPPGI